MVVAPRQIAGREREMLGFDVLTLAPINLSLVQAGVLTPDETKWLDTYHRHIRAKLSPHLPQDVRRWLVKATRRLAEVR
jgi:Xaa-Pro aminopeptidase